MNQHLAGVLVALAAAALYSVAVGLQAVEARQAPRKDTLRFALLGRLVKRPLWLAGAGINMWIGVNRAGYTYAQEFPIFLMVFAIPAGIPGLPVVIDKPAATSVNAWVCRGVTCLPPIADCAALIAVLTARAA